MTKQEIIENKIDEMAAESTMGQEFVALIALQARRTISNSINRGTIEASNFIKEFSESLGFAKHTDTAFRVVKYMYPQNCSIEGIWEKWDKIYLDKVKKSAWLEIGRASCRERV